MGRVKIAALLLCLSLALVNCEDRSKVATPEAPKDPYSSKALEKRLVEGMINAMQESVAKMALASKYVWDNPNTVHGGNEFIATYYIPDEDYKNLEAEMSKLGLYSITPFGHQVLPYSKYEEYEGKALPKKESQNENADDISI